MIDGIPAVVGLAGPLASTLVVFWLVFTGRLVVRSQHETIVQVYESQLVDTRTERDAWKATADRKGETIALQAQTNATLTESARFSDHVMSAMQELSGGQQ